MAADHDVCFVGQAVFDSVGDEVVGLGCVIAGDFFGESLVEEISTVDVVDEFTGCFDRFYVEFGVEPVGEMEGPVDGGVGSSGASFLSVYSDTSEIGKLCYRYTEGTSTCLASEAGELLGIKVRIGGSFPLFDESQSGDVAEPIRDVDAGISL